MPDLTTEFCGLNLSSPILNAAGAKDVSLADLRALGQSAAGAIVIKTATTEFRNGNATPRWHADDLGSVNSMGLPNLGYERYVAALPELKEFGKPIFASVSGLNEGDNETMITAYDAAGVDFIEVNLSCPNLEGKGQMGYDFAASRKMLASCRQRTDKPLGVKLPPYLDGFQFEQMAEVLKETGVDFVVTINSVGNTLIIDPAEERKVIAPNNGYGGLGGAYIKPIALANVNRFANMIELPVIGVGGVESGTDVFEHHLAGATLVGVGTALVNEGPDVFGRLNEELIAVLDQHKYENPAAARGQLKDLPADSVE